MKNSNLKNAVMAGFVLALTLPGKASYALDTVEIYGLDVNVWLYWALLEGTT